jgi:polyhydroxyalkanoate synthesis regulator phasin
MMVNDVRRTMEAALGKLSPKKARELARSLMQGEGRDQISRAAGDLMEWSSRNRERLTDLIRAEVRSQLKLLGVASRDELDALRKRVRELERAAGTRKGAKKRAASKRTAARTSSPRRPRSVTGAARPAGGARPAGPAAPA